MLLKLLSISFSKLPFKLFIYYYYYFGFFEVMADKDHAGGSESKGKGKEKISRGGLDIADLERINIKLESIRRERERELSGAAYEEKAPIPGKQSEVKNSFITYFQYLILI